MYSKRRERISGFSQRCRFFVLNTTWNLRLLNVPATLLVNYSGAPAGRDSFLTLLSTGFAALHPWQPFLRPDRACEQTRTIGLGDHNPEIFFWNFTSCADRFQQAHENKPTRISQTVRHGDNRRSFRSSLSFRRPNTVAQFQTEHRLNWRERSCGSEPEGRRG